MSFFSKLFSRKPAKDFTKTRVIVSPSQEAQDFHDYNQPKPYKDTREFIRRSPDYLDAGMLAMDAISCTMATVSGIDDLLRGYSNEEVS